MLTTQPPWKINIIKQYSGNSTTLNRHGVLHRVPIFFLWSRVLRCNATRKGTFPPTSLLVGWLHEREEGHFYANFQSSLL